MSWFWIIYALAHSLFRAIFAEINRVYQTDSWQLTFGQAVFTVLFLSPLFLYVDRLTVSAGYSWPTDPEFFMAAVLVALIVTVGTVIQLNLASEQSGRTSGITIPFEALGAFAIWMIVSPDSYDSFTASPLATVGFLAAFAIAIFGLLMLRRHDINRRTVMIMAPVAVTYAVAGVVTKVIVPADQIIPGVLAFVMINYVVMAVTMGVVLVLKGRVDDTLRQVKTLKASVMTGLLSLMGYSTFVAAVVLAPNPGYVSLTAVLVPVWLFMYHHAWHREDHSSAAAALLIILSVMILIVSTKI